MGLSLDLESLLKNVSLWGGDESDKKSEPLENVTGATRRAITRGVNRHKSEPALQVPLGIGKNISDELEFSESTHEDPHLPVTPPVSPPVSPPKRNGMRGKRSSSVRFLKDVSVRQLEAISDSDRSTMYYTKADIQAFKEEQKQEEEQAKLKQEEERKLARRKSRADRRRRVSERRASRTVDLTPLKNSLGKSKTARRCTSGQDLSHMKGQLFNEPMDTSTSSHL